MIMDGKTLPVQAAAILLRGCNLRNTGKVVGAVIYAGAAPRAHAAPHTASAVCCRHHRTGRRLPRPPAAA
jgi:hypothetical protein